VTRKRYKADWMRRKRAIPSVERQCALGRCRNVFTTTANSRRKYCCDGCRVAGYVASDDALDRKSEEIWRRKADAEYYVSGGWRGIGSRSPMTDL
jgi:hypothetical protein